MQNVVSETLRRSQLSVTDTRKKILEYFHHTDGALAHADIERLSGEQFDRVTIYRTLQAFVEKGIIHPIPTADNSIRYALCKEECEVGRHHDNHVHFVCDACGNTFCLDHVVIPNVQLPSGFKGKQTDVIISGVCDKCN